MRRFLYRLLARMSGGPTIEDYEEACDLYLRSVRDRSKLMNHEAVLSRKLDGLLKKNERMCLLLGEARETVAQASLTMEDRSRQLGEKDDLIARWKLAHDALRQQRDEALEQLAAIQEQTAKYVRS